MTIELIKSIDIQKQPYVDVFQNKCSKRFRNIHRKTPVLESLFNKVADLVFLLKRDSETAVFLLILRNF